MGKRGPQPKAEGERYVIRSYSLPPDLWEEVEERIPPRERSRVIQDALRKEVTKRRRSGGSEGTK